ncbi:MAG: T9SS type A sorting domain-containing protein, partial [bacterium]
APAGDYLCVGTVGTYPRTITDQDQFGFTKLGSGTQARSARPWRDSGFGDWISVGEEFVESKGAFLTPQAALIASCSPNPFNPTTTLTFTLPTAAQVTLEVFDVNGRMVGAKQSAACFARYPAGTHQIPFDGTNLPSGIFFARLTAGDYTAVQKLVLMK